MKKLIMAFMFIGVVGCSSNPKPPKPVGDWKMVNPTIQKQKVLKETKDPISTTRESRRNGRDR